MPVRMMHVGNMGMAMTHPFVAMQVRVRLARRVTRFVFVLVMNIVHMRMGMLHRFVGVGVFMNFSQMQPHAQSHQQAGCDQLHGHRLV